MRIVCTATVRDRLGGKKMSIPGRTVSHNQRVHHINHISYNEQ